MQLAIWPTICTRQLTPIEEEILSGPVSSMNELMEAGMSPHLACHRPDESWRIERLQQIARRCPKNVIGLHDHKGLLSVNWLTPPTIRELTEVVLAWASHNE